MWSLLHHSDNDKALFSSMMAFILLHLFFIVAFSCPRRQSVPSSPAAQHSGACTCTGACKHACMHACMQSPVPRHAFIGAAARVQQGTSLPGQIHTHTSVTCEPRHPLISPSTENLCQWCPATLSLSWGLQTLKQVPTLNPVTQPEAPSSSIARSHSPFPVR